MRRTRSPHKRKQRNQRNTKGVNHKINVAPPANLFKDYTKKFLQKLPSNEPKDCKERHFVPKHTTIHGPTIKNSSIPLMAKQAHL